MIGVNIDKCILAFLHPNKGGGPLLHKRLHRDATR